MIRYSRGNLEEACNCEITGQNCLSLCSFFSSLSQYIKSFLFILLVIYFERYFFINKLFLIFNCDLKNASFLQI